MRTNAHIHKDQVAKVNVFVNVNSIYLSKGYIGGIK